MNRDISVLILYSITIVIIGLLLYSLLKTPRKIIVQNELPAPQRFDTRWWGYSNWRPWWRKYGGVPGLGKPKMPKPLKPVVV